MKIALCYSGQPRHIKECQQNHIDRFLKANHEHQLYLQGFFWTTPESPEYKYIAEDWIYTCGANKETYIQIAKPKEFTHPTIVPDPRFPHPIHNTLAMFYAIEESITRQILADMDCIVRLRSDEVFLEDIGPLDKYDLTKLNVLNEFAHLDYGLNDHFAFGNAEVMAKYASTYSNFETLVSMGAAVNPECLVGFNAQIYHKLSVAKHNWKFKLYRDL